MWKYDGWESVFKFGVVTPHADIGPEAEAQAMLSGLQATVHGARVDFSPMHPGGTIDEKIAHDPVLRFVQPEIIDRTVESLASSPLDAIGLAFTSSSFKIGPAQEQELLRRLTGISRGITLETTATAAVSAMRHLGSESVAVMAPSWFDEQLCREGQSYFAGQGIDTVSVTPSGPEGGPLAITAAAMVEAVEQLAGSTGARTVFIAGNGHRAVGAINHLERDLDITVLTANQVLLWASLSRSDLRGKVSGYGRLFTDG